jgi:hypothetical protein
MIKLRKGTVKGITYEDDKLQEITVRIDGNDISAMNYTVFTGRLKQGDSVILNTTATSLGLGTGGYDFVISKNEEFEAAGPGHIMKLRYTPLQHSAMSVEEEGSPYRDKITGFKGLGGGYVIICPLHSMMAITATALKYLKDIKISYVMTDSGCLPISFSKIVRHLKEKKIIDATITIGQAFGGDLEAVNIYTGLIAAKEICHADVILVSMGPGITGTNTKYGFSGADEGYIIDAVNDLKGRAVYVPRISFSDSRDRHKGISHHSMTSLKELCHTHSDVVLPEMDRLSYKILEKQIFLLKSTGRCDFYDKNGGYITDAMNKFDLSIRTMGRVYEDDPYFYKTCAAAARFVMDNLYL